MPPFGELSITVHDDVPAEEGRIVDSGLGASNDAAAPLHEVSPVSCFARLPDGAVVGGAVGRTWGRCCELQQLWVAPERRCQGIGAALVRAFEQHAGRRGCRTFYLETFSFQAPALYRALGYEAKVELQGFSPGVVKYTMVRDTEPAPPTTEGTPVAAVEVRAAELADRPALARMLELYQHDLVDIWDQDLDAEGCYGYPLDRYWQQPVCRAFVALVDGRYAGFALVDDEVKVGSEGHWMDQFFVVRKYRRRGVGQSLAVRVFDALPGPWEVGQMAANLAAQAFWRRVIGAYTAGRFTEHRLASGWWQGVVQCFTSSPRE